MLFWGKIPRALSLLLTVSDDEFSRGRRLIIPVDDFLQLDSKWFENEHVCPILEHITGILFVYPGAVADL